MPFFWNLPFLCIFLAMVSAILLSVLPGAKRAYWITVAVSALCCLGSLVFLFRIVKADAAWAFPMGKFPAPFGNEIKIGPLQGLLTAAFSAVMCLSLLGGKEDLFRDVDGKKMGLACVMFNMVLASLFVLTYTNDIFTAYVFIEISTIAACALVMIRDSGPTLVATVRYLFISLLGSGLFLVSVVLLYAVTGHLLMPQLHESVQKLASTGEYRRVLALCPAMMTAGNSLVAQNFAARKLDRVARTVGCILLINVGFCALLALVFTLFPEQVFGLFDRDPAVLAMSHPYVPICILNMLGFATRATAMAFINGIGFSRLSFIAGFIDGIIARIGLSLLFGIVLDMGVRGFWLGSSLAGLVIGVIGAFYYFSGKWKTRKLLV